MRAKVCACVLRACVRVCACERRRVRVCARGCVFRTDGCDYDYDYENLAMGWRRGGMDVGMDVVWGWVWGMGREGRKEGY